MRVSYSLLVLAVSASTLALAGCDDRKTQWAVGCTEGVCAAVNNNGEIRYFDLSTKQATGTGKLPTTPVGTVNIDCNSSETGRAAAWSTVRAMSGLARQNLEIRSSTAASKSAAADPIGKPVPTFPDHASTPLK